MSKRVLITGAAGFIGSHLTEHLLKNTNWELVLLDKLSYSSAGMDRLRDIHGYNEYVQQGRVHMWATDISQPIPIGLEKEIGQVDYILHLAAETHVDNSITNPRPFVRANVLGTFEMLQLARRMNSHLERFIQFSTDEVFGSATKPFKEWDRYKPTNPYSATKAGADMLAIAWANTYRVPVTITHCMNVFGERQHPEKFVPMVVRKLLNNEMITIHMNEDVTESGARHYIHARNVAAALFFILTLDRFRPEVKLDKFNIVGEQEVSNLEMVETIREILEKELGRSVELKLNKVAYHDRRPGHDLRYLLDGTQLKRFGWNPPNTFYESLRKTVQWMIQPENIKWLLMSEAVMV